MGQVWDLGNTRWSSYAKAYRHACKSQYEIFRGWLPSSLAIPAYSIKSTICKQSSIHPKCFYLQINLLLDSLLKSFLNLIGSNSLCCILAKLDALFKNQNNNSVVCSKVHLAFIMRKTVLKTPYKNNSKGNSFAFEDTYTLLAM
jgi:hypothetical protein